MRKFISRSDKSCPILAIMICTCCLLSGCIMQAHTEALSSKEGYLITISNEATEKDTRWAKYLYDHLKKRSNDEEIIAFGVSEKDMWHIIIKIDPTLKEDYQITRTENEIRLIASNDKQMLWLQYQLMKRISKEDPRINGTELPPALIQLNDTCGSFAFDYQSIYSPTGLDNDYTGIVGLDNFDDSWGIWGHNLRKVLGTNVEKVYATINGKKNENQLCFSSNEMYQLVENYIIDNYGEKGKIRFVIAPDDTPLACTCPTCTAVGNNSQNATPAVTGLIIRLSKRFPEHTFFTTSYLSTQKMPNMPFPPNVGVIISAIDYPLVLSDISNSNEREFAKRLEDWKRISNNIYIWDYINNFDDYLTPFPILKVAQQRLRFFKTRGVNGIFFNGSGYSYSSFDEMRTFVLSALLINPELSINELAKQFIDQEYPVSKKWLYSYYMSLEDNLQPGKRLDIYSGIRDAEMAFLSPKDFCSFYDEMESFVSQSKGKERKKLHELQTALSFTRMELGRNHSYSTYGYAKQNGKSIHPTSQALGWLSQLKEYKAFPKMEYYNESCDGIDSYIKEWEQYILSAELSESQLLGVKPLISPQSDTNNNELSILTDGTHGLPKNYHFGWFIIPQEEMVIQLPVESLNLLGTLYLSFLHLPKHRIYAPQRIELSKDGRNYKSIEIAPVKSEGEGQMVKVQIPADLRNSKQVSLKISCPKEQRVQICLDEIAFIP